ncbi:hypothetical protein SAMN04487905_111161 [Actinopolyspora xinjiangensis]|uniref:Uncharacterized protein n=1 Tax=Actinopolyspora xinjiangensis TaxID=405564 RepID=A0A1H0WBZ7_9ACTN|nr:hypothetical protein [Actinopolyspora xinjiangensis]SDP88061.1 hypothetical protein SAMN04487905_111161 [Actinopolyspora xinjiangensis]
MAKQSPMPMPMPGGGGKLGKIIGVLAALAVLTLVVKQPVQAAQIVNSGFSALGAVVDGFAAFFMRVAQGTQ